MRRAERTAALTATLLIGGITVGAQGAGCNNNSGVLMPSGSSVTTSTTTGGGEPCGNEGITFFKEDVSPIIDQGCASCHSASYSDGYGAPDFLGSSEADYYDKLTANSRYVGDRPENSLFLKKGIHTGPAFTADQAAIVSDWLVLEASERFGDCTEQSGGGPAPIDCKSSEDLLAEFGACMTLEDWTATGMHLIATQKAFEGPCFKCHEAGAYGNYLTDPASDAGIEKGFDKTRKVPFILNLVKWPLNTPTQCGDIEPSYRWRDKGSEGNHPKYVLADGHIDALDAWFELTYGKWKNGACGP